MTIQYKTVFVEKSVFVKHPTGHHARLFDTRLFNTRLFDNRLFDNQLFDTRLFDTRLFDPRLFDTRHSISRKFHDFMKIL